MTLMPMGVAQTPTSGTTASPLRAYSPTVAAIARVLIAAARADALFVSALQRGDEPSAGQVRRVVTEAIWTFGRSGCAGRVAQEFGDHPETAVIRMRWARGVAREAFADPAAEEGMIQAQAMAACVACARMTVPYLAKLQDSVERACSLRGRSQWGLKAAAHAELFSLLAGVVDDPLLTEGAVYAREVLVVGRAADGMIVSSRRRLLAHLRAGDGDAAALEMERHLRGLLYTGRLARPTLSEAVA